MNLQIELPDMDARFTGYLCSKQGQSRLPKLSQAVMQQENHAKVIRSVSNTLKSLGKYHGDKVPLLKDVTGGMSTKEIQDTFPAVSKKCVQRSRSNAATRQRSTKIFGFTKQAVSIFETDLIGKHLQSLGYISSGSNTDTWALPMNKQEAYLDYRKTYAKLLTEADGLELQRYDPNCKKHITTLQINIELVLRYGPNAPVSAWTRQRARSAKNQKMKEIAGTSGAAGTLCVDGDQLYRLDAKPHKVYFESFSSKTTDGKVKEILFSSALHSLNFRPIYSHSRGDEWIDVDIEYLLRFRAPDTDDQDEVMTRSYWLNDECIHAFFVTLDERHADVVTMSPFWYPKVRSKTGKTFDLRGLSRFLGRRNISGCRKILFPLHVGLFDPAVAGKSSQVSDHWVLGVVELQGTNIVRCLVYDSMSAHADRQKYGKQHAVFFGTMAHLYLNCVFNTTNTMSCGKAEYVANTPQQSNGYDCGVIMSQCAELVARGENPCTLSCKKLQAPKEFRKKMLIQIVERTFQDNPQMKPVQKDMLPKVSQDPEEITANNDEDASSAAGDSSSSSSKSTSSSTNTNDNQERKNERKRALDIQGNEARLKGMGPLDRSSHRQSKKRVKKNIVLNMSEDPEEVTADNEDDTSAAASSSSHSSSTNDRTGRETEYELKRALNIQENEAMMKAMGLLDRSILGACSPRQRKTRVKKNSLEKAQKCETIPRRSSRLNLVARQDFGSGDQTKQIHCAPREESDSDYVPEESKSDSASESEEDCSKGAVERSTTPVPSTRSVSTVSPKPNERTTSTPSTDALDSPKLPSAEDLTEGKVIQPRSYKTYWRTIFRSGIKYKMVTQPYKCAIHEKAPRVKKKKLELQELKDSPMCPQPGTRAFAELNKEILANDIEYNDVIRHEAQFKNQRAYLLDREEKLPRRSPGNFQVIVYEDFVAQYTYEGKKVNNLVFTIKWRDEGGVLRQRYVDNFCSDKTKKSDSFYVRKVWAFHLRSREIQHILKQGFQTQPDGTRVDITSERRSKLTEELEILKKKTGGRFEFEGVTHILRTGDSGGHFHSRATMLWESSVWNKCGILWETHTLCKRHAYSLCDAHGGAVKRSIRARCAAGEYPRTAEEFAAIINRMCEDDEGFANARAYAFKNISRDDADAVWASLNDTAGMKQCCEFQYNVMSSDGQLIPKEGVVRMRQVSESTETPKVFDLIKQKKSVVGTFCTKCAHIKQNIVYHRKPRLECPHWHQRYVGRQVKSQIPKWGGPASHVDTSTTSAPSLLPSSVTMHPVRQPKKAPGPKQDNKAGVIERLTAPVQQAEVGKLAVWHMSEGFGVGQILNISSDGCIEAQWYGNTQEKQDGTYRPAWYQESERKFYYSRKRNKKGEFTKLNARHPAYTTATTLVKGSTIDLDDIIIHDLLLDSSDKIPAHSYATILQAVASKQLESREVRSVASEDESDADDLDDSDDDGGSDTAE